MEWGRGEVSYRLLGKDNLPRHFSLAWFVARICYRCAECRACQNIVAGSGANARSNIKELVTFQSEQKFFFILREWLCYLLPDNVYNGLKILYKNKLEDWDSFLEVSGAMYVKLNQARSVMAFDEGPFIFRINDSGGGPSLLVQVRDLVMHYKIKRT